MWYAVVGFFSIVFCILIVLSNLSSKKKRSLRSNLGKKWVSHKDTKIKYYFKYYFKMKKKQIKVSTNLYPIPQAIFQQLNKIKPHGWFSKFVNEALVEKYGRKFEEKVLVEQLVIYQRERDKLEKEILRLSKRLKKIKNE